MVGRSARHPQQGQTRGHESLKSRGGEQLRTFYFTLCHLCVGSGRECPLLNPIRLRLLRMQMRVDDSGGWDGKRHSFVLYILKSVLHEGRR